MSSKGKEYTEAEGLARPGGGSAGGVRTGGDLRCGRLGSACRSGDQFDAIWAGAPRQLDDPSIKGRQSAPVQVSQGQQPGVGHLPVAYRPAKEAPGVFRRGDLVGPELVAGHPSHLRKDGQDLRWRPGVGNHARVGGDPHEPGLGGGTGGPARPMHTLEPSNGALVVDVVGPGQGDQDVDIEEAAQESSNASRTISGVIGGVPSRTRNTGKSEE